MTTLEARGEARGVEPYLATIGLGARFVTVAGSAAQRESILPAVVEGRLKLAFAQTEAGARYDLARVSLAARKVDGGYVLDGQKLVALHAPSADKLVVSARTSGKAGDASGSSLFLVDAKAPGASMHACRTIDELRAAGIAFSNGRVPAADRLRR